MESLVTWIGGKGKYLDRILPLMPRSGKRYIEPFVGGGSLFLNAEGFGQYRIGDMCPELMGIYVGVREHGRQVCQHLKNINEAWWNIGQVFRCKEAEMTAPYREFADARDRYCTFIERVDALMRTVRYGDVFRERYTGDDAFEMEKRFQYSKMFWHLKRNPTKDEALVTEYLLTAMKMSVYSYFIELYGSGKKLDESLRNAVLMFLLEYSSNGQFTFDKKGFYRPTYAGRGHNRHSMDGKITMLKSEPFKARMAATRLFCGDAIAQMRKMRPGEEDFIVVDPPLGNMYKTVGNHTYTAEEFTALKEYLSGVKARWMMTVQRANFCPEDAFYAEKYITPVGPHGDVVVVTSYNPG